MSKDQFKAYQTMDNDTRLKLLEGEHDVLAKAVEDEQKFLEGIPCVKCGTRPCLARVDARNPFSGGILPRKIMKCLNCEVEFEPHTGIQINMGSVPKDQVEIAKMFIDPKE